MSNVSGGVVLPPDGLWNTSNLCTKTPNFINAITCPSSLGTWIRFAFNKASLGKNGEYLNVYDQYNHQTIVLNLHKRLTHPDGYMMTLLAKNTYVFQFQNANVRFGLLITLIKIVYFFILIEFHQFVLFWYCLRFKSWRLSYYSSCHRL